MKKYILFSLVLALASLALAQVTPQTSRVAVQEMSLEFHKKLSPTANGLSAYLYGSPEDVQKVIEEQFDNAAGAKSKNVKGMEAFEGVIFSEISPLTLDYYYRLEEDKNHPGKTHLYFFVSAGNYNFLSSEKYPQVIEAAQRWVGSLDRSARLQNYLKRIEAQQEVVTEAEKELEKVTDEGKDLSKEAKDIKEEIAKLQAKLAEVEKEIKVNSQTQADKRSEFEVEQVKLQTLKKERDRLNR